MIALNGSLPEPAPPPSCGEPRFELAPVADAVDQAGIERGLGHVAAGSRHRAVHVAEEQVDIGLGPRLLDLLPPGFEPGLVERHRVLLGGRRHVVADVRLDRRLVGADAIDVGGHAELVEQALVIELRSARAADQDAAQRAHPDLGRCRRKRVAVVGVADAISQHRLARGPHSPDCVGEVGDRRAAAAGERVEIERDGFDAAVVLRLVERRNEVAEPIFPGHRRARDIRPVALRGLLDDAAVEIEVENAVLDGRRLGRERAVQSGEEEDQQQQDQGILDPDEQFPNRVNELHCGS